MKPGPVIAQQLGPMGVNLGKVVQDVNKETAGFKGVKVPVEINVDAKTKQYTIQVFSPPVAELIKKELGIEKGSGTAGKTAVGNLAIEQIIGIAKTKMQNMLALDLKSAVKLVIGSCVSLGVLVESKLAKDVEKDVEAGIYDKEISQEITELSSDKQKRLATDFSQIHAKEEAAAKTAAVAAAQAEEAKTAAAAATPAAAKKEEKPAAKKK